MAFAWFVWDRDHRGPATLHRISWEADAPSTPPPATADPPPPPEPEPDDSFVIPPFLRRARRAAEDAP
jgi:hypothetical protein